MGKLSPEELHQIYIDKGVDKHFIKKWEKKWDFNLIPSEIEKHGVKVEDDFNETEYMSYFIGSVFSIYPSGKFWTFWACSNMTVREMVIDTIFTEWLTEKIEEQGVLVG